MHTCAGTRNDEIEYTAKAIRAAIVYAIDRKGYVPCSMATATRNATVTEVMGVACYSKTDVCHTSPRPAGATTANPRTQDDVSKSEAHQQSVGTTPIGVR